MSTLLSASKLSKAFGARSLFSGLTFTLEHDERIGLIGPNGAGKSTLIKILSGEVEPTGGEISRKQGLKIGLLEQSPQFSSDATLLSTVLEGVEHPDDWESQSLAREFISRLSLSGYTDDTRISILSGGWQKRVALARELVKHPDLLLLDEPTNHMDIAGITWLESFLAAAPFAVLTITHDRLFLQKVCNRIIELDPRHAVGLLSVRGDYLKYLEVREQLILAQEQREIVLKNTLRRETEWLRRSPSARRTKAKARIQQAGELEQQVAALEKRNQSRTARIDFVGAERNPKKLLEAKKISKSYGERSIFANVSLTLGPGSRLGILGQNGVGKSTLIRTLLGTEEPTSGHVFRSDQLTVSYFDQTREALDPDVTVTQALCAKGDQVEYNGKFVHVRSYLDRFLFTSQQMNMKVRTLSGGEQSRLLIAQLMLAPANLLVLDEPTNDLDIATLNVLEECLAEFQGALILVTHDRYFLAHVANLILAFPPPELSDKKLVSFADYDQWEAWRPVEVRNEKAVVEPSPLKKATKLGYKEQREIDGMEGNIQKAEARLQKLTHESTLPENVVRSSVLVMLSQQMAETQTEIERLYARWAELEAKV